MFGFQQLDDWIPFLPSVLEHSGSYFMRTYLQLFCSQEKQPWSKMPWIFLDGLCLLVSSYNELILKSSTDFRINQTAQTAKMKCYFVNGTSLLLTKTKINTIQVLFTTINSLLKGSGLGIEPRTFLISDIVLASWGVSESTVVKVLFLSRTSLTVHFCLINVWIRWQKVS